MTDVNHTTYIFSYAIQMKNHIKEYVQSEIKYDEEIDAWLFVNEPWPMLIILVVYLSFVIKFGPTMMKNRQPYNITKIYLVFDFLRFSFNGLLCLWIILTPKIPTFIFTHLCHNNKETQHEKYLIKSLHAVSWFYFIFKIIDLFDTVFFVLRKKQSHISFSHIYHHIKMVITCWIHLRFFKSELAAYDAILNSSVHIAMYGYYNLSAHGPYVPKYLCWKVYMTRVQITQLVIAMVCMAFLYKHDCNMPKTLVYTIIVELLALIYLSRDFYKTTYNKCNITKT